MATTRITEFAKGAKQWSGEGISAPLDEGPPGATDGGNTVEQAAITNGGASVASAAFAGSTRLIRITSDGIIAYVIGSAPVADVNNSRRLAAGQVEYVGVKPGHKVAVITCT